MKQIMTPPGAKRLMESLRNMGYDCASAIADIVDNSINAGASEIRIRIHAQQGARPAAIAVADNGRGMTPERLGEAMRFGTNEDYSSAALGSYGLGMKTASLSQCRVLTVATKIGLGERLQCARWDLDQIEETDDWTLLMPNRNELETWEVEELENRPAGDSGTVVLWSKLDESLPLLSASDVRQRDRFRAALVREVAAHLRMVFHRFISRSRKGQLPIRLVLGGELLSPWDPFCSGEKTLRIEPLRLPVKYHNAKGSALTQTVLIMPYVLPREDEFSDEAAWREASGPRNWNQQQGFYFYRNDRMVQAGGWSWLRSIDEHLKLLRVAVDFSQKLDHAFEINITKMKARIPAQIRDGVREAISAWARVARARYDGAKVKSHGLEKRRLKEESVDGQARSRDSPPTKTYGNLNFRLSNAPGGWITAAPTGLNGQVRIVVPFGHPAAEILFSTSRSVPELARLSVAVITLIDLIREKRISADAVPVTTLRRVLAKVLGLSVGTGPLVSNNGRAHAARKMKPRRS